ncbi:MAG: TatD family hydrolase, partial [Alphaproteobacteria bacterium]|nr:TatD family hydrolase [Alphaproteobacteria bacterium]
MSSDSSIVVDSHCHLDYLARDGRLDDAVAHARQAGVAAMLTIGTKVTAFEEVRSIAEQNPNIWCSVGVHPHEAAAEPLQEPADLVALTEHPKVIGIGESGLDYYYEHSPRAAQQASFRNHIAACR